MWNTYVALDLETTGLSPMRDQILEIGAARVENGEITGTYETFVDSGVEIPERITDLTGITAEMTAGSPQLREAVEGFLEFSGDAVLLGHNLPFDYGFMKRNVVKLGGEYERHGLDTLAIAKSVLSDLPGRALNQAAVSAMYTAIANNDLNQVQNIITYGVQQQTETPQTQAPQTNAPQTDAPQTDAPQSDGTGGGETQPDDGTVQIIQ